MNADGVKDIRITDPYVKRLIGREQKKRGIRTATRAVCPHCRVPRKSRPPAESKDGRGGQLILMAAPHNARLPRDRTSLRSPYAGACWCMRKWFDPTLPLWL